ncbi:MAG TPA: ATP-binding protein, partial [Rhabdochlamydiaceae bacterium]|nr:ATP-binding protein [Rhabdochlamydiaceae bacterium]
SDRIEIISPGHLPNHLTVEKILSGTSIARNPILISYIAKGLLPYRGLGSGIRRALEGWPQIQFVDDHDGCTFKTIIQRVDVEKAISKLLKQGAGDTVNDTVNDTLSKVEIQILELIIKNPKLSYEQIAINLEKSRITIGRLIQRLKSRKILQRIGSDKKGYWEVKAEQLS